MTDLALYAKDAARMVSMPDAMNVYGIDVGRTGFATCPFHTEDTPSMRVYDHSFYCFGCGVGGDIVDFVRRLFDLSFRDALEKINEDFRLCLPIGERPTLRQSRNIRNRRDQMERDKRLNELRKAARFRSYLSLLGEWEHTTAMLHRYKPQPDSEVLHPLFVLALQRIETLNYEIDNFDWEVKA